METTIEQQVIDTIRILPEEKQKEVLEYVRSIAKNEKKSCFGMDAGKIWIAEDFDTLPDDLMAAFYGEDDESFD